MLKKTFKCFTTAGLLATMVLSGCENTSELQGTIAKNAQNHIGTELLKTYIQTTYKHESYYSLNNGANIFVVDLQTQSKIVDACSPLLKLKTNDVVANAGLTTTFSLSKESTLKTQVFRKCVAKQLTTLEIKPEILHRLVHLEDFIEAKKNPKFQNLFAQLEKDNHISLDEAFTLVESLTNLKPNAM